MASFGGIARKVLNLPEPKLKAQRSSTPVHPRPVGGTQPSANPWEAASARLRAQDAERSTTPPAVGSADAAPWVTHDEKSGAVFARRLGRGVLWAVVGLAAVTGVRAWIVPNSAPSPPPASRSGAGPASYPTDQAQAVAARWARAYLSWDEAIAADRGRLLAADMPPGADTDIGWDGHGHQEVIAVQPGAVTPGTNHQARASVDVLVRSSTAAPADAGKKKGKGKPAAPTTTDRWIGLEVPVVATAGRVVVTGEPGMVGIPTSAPRIPHLPAATVDQALSAETKSAAADFFKAWAAGDTRSSTAPGATIPPLPDGFAVEGLSDWQVEKGDGDTRTGTARISWRVSGAVIEQTYRVQITRVSSADAHRWQVSDVRGGTT